MPGREILSIDPGMAFGTGGHETTRLVLEALEGQIRPGVRFLDVGCGSGILSIAALLLGAESAVGVDIDALAVRTARDNGELNGFTEPRFTVLEWRFGGQSERPLCRRGGEYRGRCHHCPV